MGDHDSRFSKSVALADAQYLSIISRIISEKVLRVFSVV